MGGKAFSVGPNPLSTPRLSPALYASLVSQISRRLRTLYVLVATPPPAPAKPSHGDIDIVVCSPIGTPAPITITLATLLGAERTISAQHCRCLAVPYPEVQDAYLQVDISVCEDVKNWRWGLFHHAYGDLGNLLGTTIRPWGLTVNNKGLHLRIEEIEKLDRKRSLIFLTQEPRMVCDLLGLDADRLGIDEEGLTRGGDGEHGRGFKTIEEIYEMVVGLRFFRRESYIRTTLKHNDRKRMAQRDGYSRFVDEWLPSYEGPVGGDPSLTRQGVAEEVFERFDVRKGYETRIEEWRCEREALRIKKEGREERKRKAIEEKAYADACVRALETVRSTQLITNG